MTTAHTGGTRVSIRGETFALRAWRAPDARAALVVHHGLGEHIGRYQTFADGLAGLPLTVVGYDLRGHGESSGPRGHADGLGGLADDLQALWPHLMAEAGAPTRVFVLGHSLGAAAVLRWATSHPAPAELAGLWISAPPLVVPRTFSLRVKLRLGRLLERVRPTLALGSGLSADAISSHPPEVQRYRDDPFVHDRVSAALGVSILDEAPRLLPELAGVTTPALVWHGAEDTIAHPDGGRAVFRHLGSGDKELHVLDNHRHECHHETPERAAAWFGVLREWLRTRLAT